MSDVQESAYTDEDVQRAADEINNMSPEGYLELESVVKSIEDINAIPEAGGIIFTEIVNDNGAVLHPTARATHPIRCAQMLVELLNYLRSLQPNAGWKLRESAMPSQVVSATSNVSQVVSGSGGQDQTAPPDAGQPTGAQVMQIAKVEITPRADSRVDLKLYSPGHRFPDLRVTNWTVRSVYENLLDANLNWGEDVLTQANELVGSFAAEWEFSEKTNQAGKPYKNLKRLYVPN